jgi:hypothetical protein
MIREASRQEIDELLASRGQALESEGAVFYISDIDGAMLLFSIERLDDNYCDMHICAPKSSIRCILPLLSDAFDFAVSLGYESVITSVPEGKNRTAHNMAKKIGFSMIGVFDGYCVYERCLRWQLEH